MSANIQEIDAQCQSVSALLKVRNLWRASKGCQKLIEYGIGHEENAQRIFDFMLTTLPVFAKGDQNNAGEGGPIFLVVNDIAALCEHNNQRRDKVIEAVLSNLPIIAKHERIVDGSTCHKIVFYILSPLCGNNQALKQKLFNGLLENFTAIAENSHRNAAKLVYDWLLSPQEAGKSKTEVVEGFLSTLPVVQKRIADMEATNNDRAHIMNYAIVLTVEALLEGCAQDPDLKGRIIDATVPLLPHLADGGWGGSDPKTDMLDCFSNALGKDAALIERFAVAAKDMLSATEAPYLRERTQEIIAAANLTA